jgi:predicted aconitase with swiveling domain
MKIMLRGRGVVKGFGEGEALVTRQGISFTGGVDIESGIIVEKNHELEGKSIVNKVLVFPAGKGSVGASSELYHASKAGTAPRAIINKQLDPPLVFGAILVRLPLMCDLNKDPIETIRTGDYVKVDATRGIVEITRK